ncbi:hypothetical protein [Anabaena azotica]|uniref:Uncharacterized protein n=1 Tax=Anabaena azotica FACHB-119 TaxID=947527 RepID=A0ABR8D6R7_9NOST|nr:hypothetical protein [Anabaena azotica]MBD2502870.1 hypothetical protein [Anabaena azotica FACHB-119]
MESFLRRETRLQNFPQNSKLVSRVRQYEYFLGMARVSRTDAPYILDTTGDWGR